MDKHYNRPNENWVVDYRIYPEQGYYIENDNKYDYKYEKV